jgi:hypothetical protein
MIAGKILGNEENMKWTSFTGPFGDTMGGILSPVVGIVSIYFIYKTFEAQREQLKDQTKANSLSNDAFYFQQGRLLIDEVLGKYNNLNYTKYMSFTDDKGIYCFKIFCQNMWESKLDDKDYNFLIKVHSQFKVLLAVNALGKKILDKTLKQIFIIRIYESLGVYFEEIMRIHDRLQSAMTTELINSSKEGEKTVSGQDTVKLRDIFIKWDEDLYKLSNFIYFLVTTLKYDGVCEKNDEYLRKLNQDKKIYFLGINLARQWNIIVPSI